MDKINGKPRPPLPSNQRWENCPFALRAAASWIWGDRGLLFHFFLSKIVLFVREYTTVMNSGFQVLEGGVGIFGFGHFFGQFFGFCTENLRFFAFVVLCGFPFFSIWFFGFMAKIRQVRFLCGPLFSQMLS